MKQATVRTHDALGCRIDDPQEQTMRGRPYLLPLAFAFTAVSFVAALPFSIGVTRINEHDIMRPAERFGSFVLGRKPPKG